MMKRTSRRSLFGLPSRDQLVSRAPVEPEGATSASAPAALSQGFSQGSSQAPSQAPSHAGERTQFSLDEFYRARGPQKLPPIVIRPEVLLHPVPTTSVGSPPPHEPPAVEEQPLYEELRREKERNS